MITVFLCISVQGRIQEIRKREGPSTRRQGKARGGKGNENALRCILMDYLLAKRIYTCSLFLNFVNE